MPSSQFTRNLTPVLLEALSDSPAVFVRGARQVGKSTLVRSLIDGSHPARYLTFDDASTLAAASSDPTTFIGSLDGPVILDEVQRAPELFRVLKLAIDEDRRPGRFLLTGSADVMALPQLADELAGRVALLTLRPLSSGEIRGVREAFVDVVFADDPLGLAYTISVARHSLVRSCAVVTLKSWRDPNTGAPRGSTTT